MLSSPDFNLSVSGFSDRWYLRRQGAFIAPCYVFMPKQEKGYPGRYRSGDSWLHRFDARLKILLLVGIVACLFSADSVWRLQSLAFLWLVSAQCCSGAWRDAVRIGWLLRWLLSFTLLLHLFFTPGRTLFGTSWLSLDGLLRGLLIDAQLLLAVLFSLLLAWTSRPENLAWALTSLLSPLQRLRLPVREAGGLLLLVLQFLPLIQEEVGAQQGAAELPRGLAGIKARAALVAPLLLRLVDRAELLAVELTAGREATETIRESADKRFSRFDWIVFSAGLLGLTLSWML